MFGFSSTHSKTGGKKEESAQVKRKKQIQQPVPKEPSG
jgi:hypothetical protein